MAIEFAIVSLLLVLFSLGAIEFGRALEVRNQLAFVADMASRQILNNSSVSDAAVETIIRDAFEAPSPDLLQVEFGAYEDTVNDVQFRTVTLRYPFVLLIPQLSSEAITLSASERVPVT